MVVGGAATSEVGVGVPVAVGGYFVVALGADQSSTGFRRMMSGQMEPSVVETLAQAAGASPQTAAYIDAGLNIYAPIKGQAVMNELTAVPLYAYGASADQLAGKERATGRGSGSRTAAAGQATGTVFSGHGSYDDREWTHSPSPTRTSLTVYSRPTARPSRTGLGNAIETGADLSGVCSRTYQAGEYHAEPTPCTIRSKGPRHQGLAHYGDVADQRLSSCSSPEWGRVYGRPALTIPAIADLEFDCTTLVGVVDDTTMQAVHQSLWPALAEWP